MIAATLFAKALGLLRSALLARTLGDLPEAAAFAAASGIPGAIFDILFSAAITGAFIPAYSAAREEGEESARAFSRAFLGAALAAALLFSLAGVAFAPAIIRVFAANMSEETAALAVRLLRIMFPSAVFTAWAYTLAGLLQAHESFVLPAAVSALSFIVPENRVEIKSPSQETQVFAASTFKNRQEIKRRPPRSAF
jgi:putative peptidoglycan lipid II flippase